jgi:K+-sensing histidine kinase KdpD
MSSRTVEAAQAPVEIKQFRWRYKDNRTISGLNFVSRRRVFGEATAMKAFHSLLSLLICHAFRARDAALRRVQATSSAWLGGSTTRVGFDVMRILAHTMLFPLACVALTTGLLAVALKYTALEFDLIIYLIPVVTCAVRWGRVAAIVAIFATAAVVDFLWLPPVYSFAISDPSQIVELTLFVFVALVTSHLAARLRSKASTLQRREHEVYNLYEFSRRLALCATAGDLLKAIQDYLSAHLGCETHLIHVADSYAGGEDEQREGVPQSIVQAADGMVDAREPGSRLVSEPETDSLWALKYIATAVAGHGVLAINLGAPSRSDIRRLNESIDAWLAEASSTLTRIDAAAALAKANMRLESEIVRASLLNMAHDLRSPVAAILGSASVLDQIPTLRDNEKMRSLVNGMHHEALRLNNDIQTLLDTVRITSSGVSLRVAWTDQSDRRHRSETAACARRSGAPRTGGRPAHRECRQILASRFGHYAGGTHRRRRGRPLDHRQGRRSDRRGSE